MGITYDTGALVAADRGQRRIWARHRALLARRVVPTAPAPVVAQSWRGGRRQAMLARLLAGCDIEALHDAQARSDGSPSARAPTTDTRPRVCPTFPKEGNYPTPAPLHVCLATPIPLGDVRKRLRELPASSIDTVINSPPYFGVRDYGHDQQLGAERSVDNWANELQEICDAFGARSYDHVLAAVDVDTDSVKVDRDRDAAPV